MASQTNPSGGATSPPNPAGDESVASASEMDDCTTPYLHEDGTPMTKEEIQELREVLKGASQVSLASDKELLEQVLKETSGIVSSQAGEIVDTSNRQSTESSSGVGNVAFIADHDETAMEEEVIDTSQSNALPSPIRYPPKVPGVWQPTPSVRGSELEPEEEYDDALLAPLISTGSTKVMSTTDVFDMLMQNHRRPAEMKKNLPNVADSIWGREVEEVGVDTVERRFGEVQFSENLVVLITKQQTTYKNVDGKLVQDLAMVILRKFWAERHIRSQMGRDIEWLEFVKKELAAVRRRRRKDGDPMSLEEEIAFKLLKRVGSPALATEDHSPWADRFTEVSQQLTITDAVDPLGGLEPHIEISKGPRAAGPAEPGTEYEVVNPDDIVETGQGGSATNSPVLTKAERRSRSRTTSLSSVKGVTKKTSAALKARKEVAHGAAKSEGIISQLSKPTKPSAAASHQPTVPEEQMEEGGDDLQILDDNDPPGPSGQGGGSGGGDKSRSNSRSSSRGRSRSSSSSSGSSSSGSTSGSDTSIATDPDAQTTPGKKATEPSKAAGVVFAKPKKPTAPPPKHEFKSFVHDVTKHQMNLKPYGSLREFGFVKRFPKKNFLEIPEADLRHWAKQFDRLTPDDFAQGEAQIEFAPDKDQNQASDDTKPFEGMPFTHVLYEWTCSVRGSRMYTWWIENGSIELYQKLEAWWKRWSKYKNVVYPTNANARTNILNLRNYDIAFWRIKIDIWRMCGRRPMLAQAWATHRTDHRLYMLVCTQMLRAELRLPLLDVSMVPRELLSHFGIDEVPMTIDEYSRDHETVRGWGQRFVDDMANFVGDNQEAEKRFMASFNEAKTPEKTSGKRSSEEEPISPQPQKKKGGKPKQLDKSAVVRSLAKGNLPSVKQADPSLIKEALAEMKQKETAETATESSSFNLTTIARDFVGFVHQIWQRCEISAEYPRGFKALTTETWALLKTQIMFHAMKVVTEKPGDRDSIHILKYFYNTTLLCGTMKYPHQFSMLYWKAEIMSWDGFDLVFNPDEDVNVPELKRKIVFWLATDLEWQKDEELFETICRLNPYLQDKHLVFVKGRKRQKFAFGISAECPVKDYEALFAEGAPLDFYMPIGSAHMAQETDAGAHLMRKEQLDFVDQQSMRRKREVALKHNRSDPAKGSIKQPVAITADDLKRALADVLKDHPEKDHDEIKEIFVKRDKLIDETVLRGEKTQPKDWKSAAKAHAEQLQAQMNLICSNARRDRMMEDAKIGVVSKNATDGEIAEALRTPRSERLKIVEKGLLLSKNTCFVIKPDETVKESEDFWKARVKEILSSETGNQYETPGVFNAICERYKNRRILMAEIDQINRDIATQQNSEALIDNDKRRKQAAAQPGDTIESTLTALEAELDFHKSQLGQPPKAGPAIPSSSMSLEDPDENDRVNPDEKRRRETLITAINKLERFMAQKQILYDRHFKTAVENGCKQQDAAKRANGFVNDDEAKLHDSVLKAEKDHEIEKITTRFMRNGIVRSQAYTKAKTEYTNLEMAEQAEKEHQAAETKRLDIERRVQQLAEKICRDRRTPINVARGLARQDINKEEAAKAAALAAAKTPVKKTYTSTDRSRSAQKGQSGGQGGGHRQPSKSHGRSKSKTKSPHRERDRHGSGKSDEKKGKDKKKKKKSGR